MAKPWYIRMLDSVASTFKAATSSNFGTDDPPRLKALRVSPSRGIESRPNPRYVGIRANTDTDEDIDLTCVEDLEGFGYDENLELTDYKPKPETVKPRLMPAGLEHDLANPDISGVDPQILESARRTYEFLDSAYSRSIKSTIEARDRSELLNNIKSITSMTETAESHLAACEKREPDVIFKVNLANGTPVVVKCSAEAPRTFSVSVHDEPVFSSRSIYAAMNVAESMIQSAYTTK